MNKVILIGRLAADPQLTNTQAGVPACRFNLAVDRNYVAQDGKRQADFISCIAWRNQAENLVKFQKKGSQIAVEGNIQTGSYINQTTGATVYTTVVVCDHITFLGTKSGNGGGFDINQMDIPPVRNNNNNSYNDFNQEAQGKAFDDLDKSIDFSDDIPFNF